MVMEGNRERSLDRLINSSPDPIWLIDKELRLVIANKAFLESVHKDYGVRIREGDPVLFTEINEDYREIWKRLFDKVFQGERVTIEYPDEGGIYKEGFYFDLGLNPVYDEQGDIAGIGCFTQDITQRKKTADLINRSRSELSEAQKLAQSGTWSFDIITSKTTWSEGIYHVFGIDPGTTAEITESFFHLVDEADQGRVHRARSLSRSHGIPFDIEFGITTPSGEKRIIQSIGRSERDATNKIIRVFGTAQNITERKRAEEEIKASYQQFQELTSRSREILEEERTRIAREIHDELGQQLTSLKMDASWISNTIPEKDREIQEKLLNMIALIDDTVKTVRRISSELRPGILDDLGLLAALEWHAEEFEKRTGIVSHFVSELNDFNPEGKLATSIFRVYQEALTNIARHAGATRVETVFEKKEGHIRLTIKDDGQGFNLKEVKSRSSLGLIGMKERALMFQGDLVIEHNAPKGTIVILKIPF
jgi:PAS domain S-box-containing protein